MKGIENLAHIADPISGFLLDFRPDPLLRTGIVQETRRRLCQKIVVAIDVSRISKLPGQKYRTPLEVVEKDRRTVAAIIGFRTLPLPGPVPCRKLNVVFFRMYQSLESVVTSSTLTPIRYRHVRLPPHAIARYGTKPTNVQ